MISAFVYSIAGAEHVSTGRTNIDCAELIRHRSEKRRAYIAKSFFLLTLTIF